MKQLTRNLVLACALVAGLGSCTAAGLVNGALVAAQGLFISDTDEVRLGAQTAAKVLSETPEYPNQELKAYVTDVGRKLAAASERPNLAWQFFVVETTDINAFAAPGGYLFVTTGALRLMSNEAQLAGVMGHEITHVAHKHSVHALQRELVAQGVATALLQGNTQQLYDLASSLAANLILKGFDRNDELDADKGGAKLAYQLGYDPRELGTFLDELRRQTGEIPSWLVATSDHPRTDDRLTQLSDYMTAQGMDFSNVTKAEAPFAANVTAKLGSSVSASPSP